MKILIIFITITGNFNTQVETIIDHNHTVATCAATTEFVKSIYKDDDKVKIDTLCL